MSESEENEIIGRLARELAGHRKIAMLAAQELEHFASGLQEMLTALRMRVQSPDYKVPEFPAAVVRYADLAKLRTLLTEQETAHAKMRDLAKRLNEMGV